MRKSVFWAGLFMLAALLLRLFAPLAPDPVVRDAFVLLFAGAGLLFAGFSLCETGPLAAAREALDFEAKAHFEREEYRNERVRRLESARNGDLAQLDNALLQAATLENRNKTLEDNGKALFARVERAERANANLRAEVRNIAMERAKYGAVVGVLGRVLDGCRFVGDAATTKYMGLIVRECREKYRNPRLGDEEKRALLSVEIQAGALLRLAPPGKGGAAFTVESVPLVADGPAPERHTSDMAWPQVKDVVEFFSSPTPGAPVPQGQYIVTTAYEDGTVDVATLCGVAGFSKVSTLVLCKPKDAVQVFTRVKFIIDALRPSRPAEVFNVTRLNGDGTVDLVSDGGRLEYGVSRSRLVLA